MSGRQSPLILCTENTAGLVLLFCRIIRPAQQQEVGPLLLRSQIFSPYKLLHKAATAFLGEIDLHANTLFQAEKITCQQTALTPR